MARTKITVDYRLCGDGTGVDPRECGRCLRACAPAVFILHQTIGAVELDPLDPKAWRVTPMWASVCDQCGECVTVCPEGAIEISSVGFWRTKRVMSAGAGKRPAAPENGPAAPGGTTGS
jgi:NAD-dependent dihydropyrimidine dehydrogenase PreA subunit